MKAELYYITDAYCIWCYGIGPTIDLLAKDYSDRVQVRVLSGGMIPTDTPIFSMFGRFPDPIALHERVTSMSGQAFGSNYMDHIKNLRSSKLILNSTMPARALRTFTLLGAKDELATANAIQNTYYAEGRDLQDVTSYSPIASQFGISFSSFLDMFDGPEVALAMKEERQVVDYLGVQGYPALLLSNGEDRFTTIARGFMPFADIKANLDAALSLYSLANEPSAQQGNACALDGSGC